MLYVPVSLHVFRAILPYLPTYLPARLPFLPPLFNAVFLWMPGLHTAIKILTATGNCLTAPPAHRGIVTSLTKG